MIKELQSNPELAKKLRAILNEMSEHQAYVLAFFGRDAVKNLSEREYFKSENLEWLNEYPSIMGSSSRFLELLRKVDISSTLCAVTALLLSSYVQGNSALTPFIDNFKDSAGERIKRPFRFFGFFLSMMTGTYKNGALTNYASKAVSLLSGFYGGFSLSEGYQWDQDQLYLFKIMHDRLYHVREFFKRVSKLHSLLNEAKILKHIEGISLWEPSDDASLLRLLTDNSFSEPYSYFHNRGKVLVHYLSLTSQLKELQNILRPLGELDVLVSVSTFMDTRKDTENPVSFAEFVEADSPQIGAEEFWNPMIKGVKVVTNSVNLGANQTEKSLLIMGPNAGGKSTVLRSLTYNVVLAQSLGIATAKSFKLTPFYGIVSAMEISDDPDNNRSKFRNEAFKAGKLLKKSKSLKQGQFLLTIMDEMFSSTSPLEGQSAAFAFAKNLGEMNNLMNFLVSHYPSLKALPGYQKYHTTVVRNDDGTLFYPFKIQDGTEYDVIAFDVLKEEGMDSFIIEEAEKNGERKLKIWKLKNMVSVCFFSSCGFFISRALVRTI